MMNGKKVFRLALSGCLLAVLVVACVGLYQVEMKNKQKNMSKEIEMQEETAADDSEEITEEEPSENVDTSSVEGTKEVETAEVPETEQETAQASPAEEPVQENTEETVSSEVVEEQPETPVEPVIDFTEDSLIEWPVNGNVLLDYSMDQTVYHPTLDVYKYNPAIVIGAEVNTPVMAVANGQVVSIAANEETGTTVTMDMGNGYQAVYGQMKEVAFEEGDIVEGGTIIGYVSEPTKYYITEGSNLYFAMTKDGGALDPLLYLP